AEALAEQPAGMADAAAVVDRESNGDGVDHLAILGLLELIALVEHPAHVRIRDFAAVDGNFRLDDSRGREAAGEVHHHLRDGLARHLLGGVHGAEDRLARRVEIDDEAVPHAARNRRADAEDARAALFHARREAAEFAAADVERRDQAAVRARAACPHAALPGFFFLIGAGLADSGTCRTSRSGSRRSTFSMSR